MSSEDRQEHMLSAPMLNFSIEKALEQLKSETQWKNENKKILFTSNPLGCSSKKVKIKISESIRPKGPPS